ncbi:MAG: carboxypeptidase regulatory-like domain-containing protein [Acidobacteriia bacterium]|nr:carboxypeptidase regulatory-like domain-containing protein [Terriglobia bacterium]
MWTRRGLLRNTRKTELPAANLSLVFLWGLVARRAPFALLNNSPQNGARPGASAGRSSRAWRSGTALCGLLGFLLFSGVHPLLADEDLAKLVVEVKTLTGKPIDRASVIVKFVEGRSIVKFGKKIKTNWELRTNQQGMVKIPPVPQGKILVQVIAKGYQTFGQTYEILEEEKTIEVKLKPPQPQYSAHE